MTTPGIVPRVAASLLIAAAVTVGARTVGLKRGSLAIGLAALLAHERLDAPLAQFIADETGL